MSSDWKESSLNRRDFRATHGGPEEMPHRRKKVRIHKPKCKHEYKSDPCGVWEWGLNNYTNVRYERFECATCGKMKYTRTKVPK